jgi:hypothetical protein
MALTETAGTSNGTPTTGSGVTPAGIYPFGASFVSGEFTVFSVQLRSAGAGASSLIPSWTKIATRQQFYPVGRRGPTTPSKRGSGDKQPHEFSRW